MKIKAECIPCLLERAKFECDLAFNDEAKKNETLFEIVRYFGNKLNSDVVPAALGTQRERIIKKNSEIYDPYSELKKASERVALKLLPLCEDFYERSKDKIEAIIRIAASANSMEYGVKGYDYDDDIFQQKFEDGLNERLVGDIKGIKKTLDKHDKILYLTDNAGEVVFDKFIAERMVDMGKEVVISPKNAPIINDATVEDIKNLNFDGFEIVPSGSYVGLSLEEAPEDFLKLFWNEDYLIFAKGMGYYETISEFEQKLKGRLIYVLRAKCISVASSIGAKQGSLVAKLA